MHLKFVLHCDEPLHSDCEGTQLIDLSLVQALKQHFGHLTGEIVVTE